MNDIKPVIKPMETFYNGYRFRSRLEARWAVFFDSLKIKYNYEVDGYRLDNGECYLPDFYLPDFEIYVEIKQEVENSFQAKELSHKSERFRDDKDMAILVCFGDPMMENTKMLFAWDVSDGSAGTSNYGCEFIDYDGTIYLLCTDVPSSKEICINGHYQTNDRVVSFGMLPFFNENQFYKFMRKYHEDRTIFESDRLYCARLDARQARFEHGEKPVAKR